MHLTYEGLRHGKERSLCGDTERAMDRQTDSLWAMDGVYLFNNCYRTVEPLVNGTQFLELASYPVPYLQFTLATCKSLMGVICRVEG